MEWNSKPSLSYEPLRKSLAEPGKPPNNLPPFTALPFCNIMISDRIAAFILEFETWKARLRARTEPEIVRAFKTPSRIGWGCPENARAVSPRIWWNLPPLHPPVRPAGATPLNWISSVPRRIWNHASWHQVIQRRNWLRNWKLNCEPSENSLSKVHESSAGANKLGALLRSFVANGFSNGAIRKRWTVPTGIYMSFARKIAFRNELPSRTPIKLVTQDGS